MHSRRSLKKNQKEPKTLDNSVISYKIVAAF